MPRPPVSGPQPRHSNQPLCEPTTAIRPPRGAFSPGSELLLRPVSCSPRSRSSCRLPCSAVRTRQRGPLHRTSLWNTLSRNPIFASVSMVRATSVAPISLPSTRRMSGRHAPGRSDSPLCAQFPAALNTSRPQDSPSGSRRHPRHEAMLALPRTGLWLICTFHHTPWLEVSLYHAPMDVTSSRIASRLAI